MPVEPSSPSPTSAPRAPAAPPAATAQAATPRATKPNRANGSPSATQWLGKLFALAVIGVVLAILLGRTMFLVHEREQLRASVVQGVSESYAQPQTVMLPYVLVNYTRHWTTEHTATEDGKPTIKRIAHSDQQRHAIPADQVRVETSSAASTRSRGIYSALVYDGPVKISGTVTLPENNFGIETDPDKPGMRIEVTRIALVLGVQDVRGIKDVPQGTWAGQPATLRPSSTGVGLARGLEMVIDPATPKRSHPFTMQLTLAGTQSIQWIPTARNAVLEATGNWPHPSFNGRFLPDKREVTDQGYRATWQLSEFSHDTPAALARCARESALAAKQAERGHEVCSGVHHNTFGINYVQPGDLYAQLDRATKYGFLFIGLTFAAFLLTELLKRMSVHPVQYGLTGLALAMFFVLLIALSEHIAFAHAYGIASAACVTLIAYYVAYALGTWKAGATFGAGLASLYVAMYWLLKSEQYALLLGAGLLFGLLAAVMVGTRKVDWYGLKPAKAAA